MLEFIVQFDNTTIDPSTLCPDTRDRASVPTDRPGSDTSLKATTENIPQVVLEIYGATNKDKTITSNPINRPIYRITARRQHQGILIHIWKKGWHFSIVWYVSDPGGASFKKKNSSLHPSPWPWSTQRRGATWGIHWRTTPPTKNPKGTRKEAISTVPLSNRRALR